jgi:hypothetical protein
MASVAPADLLRHLDTYGRRATVITVSADRRAHVGTSLVEVDGEEVLIQVGHKTAELLAGQPDLCLTWSPPEGEDYQLIVDGIATGVRPVGDLFEVVVSPQGGIRHRVAGANDDGPSCLALDE